MRVLKYFCADQNQHQITETKKKALSLLIKSVVFVAVFRFESLKLGFVQKLWCRVLSKCFLHSQATTDLGFVFIHRQIGVNGVLFLMAVLFFHHEEPIFDYFSCIVR